MAAPVHNPTVVREYDAAAHPGRDYRTTPGTTVRATLAGVVVQVRDELVVVETNAIQHLYRPLSGPTVREGETVETGEVLGVAAGAHLHYEERGDGVRKPQFDLHTNARMRVVAPGESAVEGAAEPPGATVHP
ncbi:M23 family metallopeptidase [Kribbella sandramycini]|uniref:M23 family metallopeptidase n=1 Tax=Kribbella sandramycini TaxID=60450 RepID=A0A7Y4KXP1_9ACTN|nr:M23 family metallopeptidase [Kribbella sandramycini]MBB6567819.1 murein DD-endopeptidase MepM/ murein hydrolase activator NlpD [Kribbella sandramycini]NOL39586.1 M23 family metallopeptidase [Kribbella sandramycini]